MPHFLDSNIPMYAHGMQHPLKSACIAVLDQAAQGRLEAVTSAEVVQEIVHRYIRVGRRDLAQRVAQSLLSVVPNVLPVTREDVNVMLLYMARFPRLSARDLLHAAVMVNNGIETIISADEDFDALPMIKRLDPRRVG